MSDERGLVKEAMQKCFPLCNENNLPWAISQLPSFLKERIEFEIKRGMKHFESSVVKIICEVAPPKTYLVDMCHIAVDKAKATDKIQDELDREKLAHAKTRELLRQYADRDSAMTSHGEKLNAEILDLKQKLEAKTNEP